MTLKDKTIVVTGASSGIGAGCARALAAAGAQVGLVGRDMDRLAAASGDIGDAGGSCLAIEADLTEDAAPREVVSQTIDAFGSLDGLIHSAGVFQPRPFAETSLAELDRHWAINVRAPYALTQAALPQLEGGGAVVFISSELGGKGAPNCSAYCASKGAVEQLTRALASELGPKGVRVNCIAPGATRTRMNEGFRRDDPQWEQQLADGTAARRWGEVEDIAPAAVFLVSAAADYMHGAVVHIDGGSTID